MDTVAKHEDGAGRYAPKGLELRSVLPSDSWRRPLPGTTSGAARVIHDGEAKIRRRRRLVQRAHRDSQPSGLYPKSNDDPHSRTEARIEIMDEDLFAYPVLYLTGHGNIRFTEDEVVRLRTYLEHGGFLFANDDYGLDKAFRREITRTFPDKELVELPPSFGIFQHPFPFPDGLPKIHEHDGKRPQAFGIFHEGRLVVFYNYECDLGDGWNDAAVHNDPPEKRDAALKMGTNVVVWALTH